MAAVTEENVRRVERLLDMLEGSEGYLGRVEPRESGPVGTHEPCLGHNENVRLWGYCPACEGEGLVKTRHGTRDPYLLAPFGEAAESPPAPDPPSPQPVGEYIRLSPTERHAFRNLRVRRALDTIRSLLRRAPRFEEDRLLLEWLVKRMGPGIPRV